MHDAIDAQLLAPFIRTWIREGNRLNHLGDNHARYCREILAGTRTRTSLDRADRLLVAMDASPDILNQIAPLELA